VMKQSPSAGTQHWGTSTLKKKRIESLLRRHRLAVTPHLEIGYFPGIAETESVVLGSIGEIDHLAFV